MRLLNIAWVDPEWGHGVRSPLKNHKNMVFLSNTGPDPLKIKKLPSQHSMLRAIIGTPAKRYLMTRLAPLTPHQLKKCQSWTPLTNFLYPHMYRYVSDTRICIYALQKRYIKMRRKTRKKYHITFIRKRPVRKSCQKVVSLDQNVGVFIH